MDQHIKDVLKNYVDNSKIKKGYYSNKIKAYWYESMGESITSRTTDLYLRGTTLHVLVSSAPLKNELFNHRDKIMSRINEYLNEEIVQEVLIK